MLANSELRDDSVIGADDVSHLDCGRRHGRLDERAWRPVVKSNVDAVIGPTHEEENILRRFANRTDAIRSSSRSWELLWLQDTRVLRPVHR
jgi:hypothetical protein